MNLTKRIIYIGEAQDLITRFKEHEKNNIWEYYKFICIPPCGNKQKDKYLRLAIESMLIDIFSSIMKNKINVNSKDITNFMLLNKK